jgi:hypothetical protein
MRKRIYIHPITVVISEELNRRLQEITQQIDISLSEWVRDAINRKLSNELIKNKDNTNGR